MPIVAPRLSEAGAAILIDIVACVEPAPIINLDILNFKGWKSATSSIEAQTLSADTTADISQLKSTASKARISAQQQEEPGGDRAKRDDRPKHNVVAVSYVVDIVGYGRCDTVKEQQEPGEGAEHDPEIAPAEMERGKVGASVELCAERQAEH